VIRLALVISGLLLPLLVFELALRTLGPIFPGNYQTGSYLVANPIYGRFHVPRFDGWIRAPEFISRVRTNSIGLRDDETSVPKPDGTFRILVLGDSYVEGAQVMVGEPFTEVLERALNARPEYPGRPLRYDVLNAGVAGWGQAPQYLWLKQEGLSLEPDLVVLQFYPGNDIADLGCRTFGMEESRKVCFYLNDRGELYQDEMKWRAPDPGDPVRAALRNHSLLFNAFETGVLEKLESGTLTVDQLWQDAWRSAGASDGEVSSEPRGEAHERWRFQLNVYGQNLPQRDARRWETAWRIERELIAAMKRESEAAGAQFLLTVAPDTSQLFPEEWEKTVRDYRLDSIRPDPRLPLRRLERIARDTDALYLDHGPFLQQAASTSSRPLWYRFDGHFTAVGHEAVARSLEAFLLAQGLVP
jgi:hypothetical protein